MRTRTRITFEAAQNRLCRDFGGFLVLEYHLILRPRRGRLREKAPVGPLVEGILSVNNGSIGLESAIQARKLDPADGK